MILPSEVYPVSRAKAQKPYHRQGKPDDAIKWPVKKDSREGSSGSGASCGLRC